jgi:hypothetical protein
MMKHVEPGNVGRTPVNCNVLLSDSMVKIVIFASPSIKAVGKSIDLNKLFPRNIGQSMVDTFESKAIMGTSDAFVSDCEKVGSHFDNALLSALKELIAIYGSLIAYYTLRYSFLIFVAKKYLKLSYSLIL